MKKLLVILLLILSFNISSAQSGWGYVNYTSYKTHNGNGNQGQYAAFPYTKAEFDNMLNTANSYTTITHTGETALSNVYNGSSPYVLHWGGDYYAIKFEFYFVPQETGTYTFLTTSDDASDFSVNGTVIITDYGGHGAGNWKAGSIQMTAGTKYTIIGRYQEYGGGDSYYIRWSRPSAPNTYSYWNNEVTNIGSTPSKQGRINFDFGSTLDKTKFTAAKALGSNGWADITNAIDSIKIGSGYKAIITPGQVEWSYTNPNANWLNGNSRLLIDMRQVGSIDPTKINSAKIFDAYDSTITYTSHDANGWAIYTVPSPLTKITDGSSASNSYIRDVNNWHTDYAFQSTITFDTLKIYKPQSVTVTTTNNLTTLYNSIVTVSDVYLAFKEYSEAGGIFGGGFGTQFTYGIQYKNADIDDNGVFDEADCFRLLQHLTGTKNIVDTFNLRKTLKLIPTTTYNTISKSNWNTFSSYLGDTYNFDINTGKATDTFYLSGTWKGDVNLSHSATPPSNGIANMAVKMATTSISQMYADIMSQLTGDSLYVEITFNPGDNNIVGTQFQLNYDNTLLKYSKIEYKINGNPTNYSVDKGAFVNLGSLNSDGSQITSATYKILFTTKQKLNGSLGLISIGTTEAVSKDGKSLIIKVQ